MGKGKKEEEWRGEEDEGDATITQLINKQPTKNQKKKAKKNEEEEGSNSSTSVDCVFPMSRIRRIIKSEGSAIHISLDSVFLINKASEKFLELFCKEAYARIALDKKKQLEYKHLSSVVGKRKRFDFLSDFVPEKVKAGVALAEMSSAET